MERWLTSRTGTAVLGIVMLPLLLLFTAAACIELVLFEGVPWSITIRPGDFMGELPPGRTLTLWTIDKKRPNG